MSEDLIGYKELSKKLKRMGGKAADTVIKRGNAKMSQVVAKEMRKAAPVKSGNLRKSISYQNKKMRHGGYGAKVGAFKSRRADGFYADFIESGTGKYLIRPRKTKSLSFKRLHYREVEHKGVRPKPFIRPAFKRSYRRAQVQAGALMFKLITQIK